MPTSRYKWIFTSNCWEDHLILLHSITSHCIPLDFNTYYFLLLHSITYYCIPLYFIVLHFIPLHSITLHLIKFHWIASQFILCITSHCISLYFIVLHPLHSMTYHHIPLNFITYPIKFHYILFHTILLHYWNSYLFH